MFGFDRALFDLKRGKPMRRDAWTPGVHIIVQPERVQPDGIKFYPFFILCAGITRAPWSLTSVDVLADDWVGIPLEPLPVKHRSPR